MTKAQEAIRLALTNLVEALNLTTWSSWQTTAQFSDQLKAAEAALADHSEGKPDAAQEPSPTFTGEYTMPEPNVEQSKYLKKAYCLAAELKNHLSVAPASQFEPTTWKPIATAPKDNKRKLYLAQFASDTSELLGLDYYGQWWYPEAKGTNGLGAWECARGLLFSATHWAYQDEPIPQVPFAENNDGLVRTIARALCKESAECCQVNEADDWEVYSQSYFSMARVALDAMLAAQPPKVEA